MRLTGYLFWFSLTRFVGSLGVLVTIYCAIDFVEASSLTRGDLLSLLAAYPFKIPSVITHVLPLSCAIGAVITLANLRSRGEWDALIIAGLSPLRLIAPLLLVSLLCSVFAMILVDTLAPRAYALYEDGAGLRSLRGVKEESIWSKQDSWITRRGPDDTIIAIERLSSGKAVRWVKLKGVDGVSKKKIVSTWSAESGFEVDTEMKKSLPAFNFEPRSFLMSADGLLGANETSRRLKTLISNFENRGLDPTPIVAQLSLRRSLAISCLLVTALALMFSLLFSRWREVGLMSVALCVSVGYWLLLLAVWNGAAAGVFAPSWVSTGVSAIAMVGVLIVGVIGVRATPPRR